jgi:hypothetical protein
VRWSNLRPKTSAGGWKVADPAYSPPPTTPLGVNGVRAVV